MNFAVKADPCLFATFALLNTIGYHAESGWHFTELRKNVRLRLAYRADHWRSTLRTAGLLDSVLRAGGATLMDMVPLLSIGSDFPVLNAELEYTTQWQNESKVSLAGIGSWLNRFYNEENIGDLWEECRSSYDKAVVLYREIESSIQNVVTQFSETNDLAKLSIVVEPNLLDARGRGYSLSAGDRTWLFIGPTEDLHEIELIAVHELLHRWVDVAAEKIVFRHNTGDLMLKAKAMFRMVAESYPEVAIWIGETVVRAATAWLKPPEHNITGQRRDELVSYYEQLGFIGFRDAYTYFINESKASLPEALNHAVYLVNKRVNEW